MWLEAANCSPRSSSKAATSAGNSKLVACEAGTTGQVLVMCGKSKNQEETEATNIFNRNDLYSHSDPFENLERGLCFLVFLYSPLLSYILY